MSQTMGIKYPEITEEQAKTKLNNNITSHTEYYYVNNFKPINFEKFKWTRKKNREKANLLKLTQKQKVNPKISIPIKENKPIIKDLPPKKSQPYPTSLVTSKLTKEITSIL